jgi:FkbM family methyltransferase
MVSLQSLAARVPHPDNIGALRRRGASSDVDIFRKVSVDCEYAPSFDHPLHSTLDLSANVDLASLFFQRRYPDARIVAIEPDPGNFELLQANTQPYPTLTCLHAATATRSGTVTLHDPGLGPWAFRTCETATDCPTVPALTVPELLTHSPSQRVDLLKIDIEGTEKLLFADSPALLQAVDAIVIALHDRYQPGCSRAFFNAVKDFPNEHWSGENVWVWR